MFYVLLTYSVHLRALLRRSVHLLIWQNTFEAAKGKIVRKCSNSQLGCKHVMYDGLEISDSGVISLFTQLAQRKDRKAYLENAAAPFRKFLPSTCTRMNHDINGTLNS